MVRRDDWEERLSAFLAAHADEELVFGTLDCALFGCSAAEAQTGVDQAAAFRGRYKTARGAIRALKVIGAGTLKATLDTLFPAKGVAFARRGDLVMRRREAGDPIGAVGVCIGAEAVFLPREGRGYVRVPRADWVRAWGVG